VRSTGDAMTPQQAADELARLEIELAEARESLRRDPRVRYRDPWASAPPGTFRLGLLGAVAIVAGIVAALGVVDGSWPVIGGATAVAGLTVAVMVWIARRITLPAHRDQQAVSRAPRERQRALLLEVDAVYAALDGRAPAASDRPLALPRSRQPGFWAQSMHGRWGRGDPPDVVLRRLPPDAPGWRVWFHRAVGLSGLWAIVLVTVLLVVAVGWQVVQLRRDP
jgi:hypothetical protein